MYDEVKLEDIFHGTFATYNPTTGANKDADALPSVLVYEEGTSTEMNVPISVTNITNGRYRYQISILAASGFEQGKFYDVWASAIVTGDETLSQFAPLTAFKATQSVVDDVHFIVSSSLYYANIKYVKDTTNLRDEYSCLWFKDTAPVSSGSLTNPAISVYNTTTGAALFSNQVMSYASTQLGVVRYNDGSFLTASGEPYMIVVSGTIDNAARRWQQIVGLDLF